MDRILTLTMNPALDVSTTAARVEPVHKLRCSRALVHPGGGGINVARVLTRLEAEAVALYPAGGAAGQRLLSLLAAERVTARTILIGGETRESFSVHETATGLDWRFVLPGPVLLEEEWQACLDQAVELSQPCRLVVASGSLPPGVPQDFYARLARRLAAQGVNLAVDSSGGALGEALDAGVHLVKPSLRELQEVSGVELTTREQRLAACRRLVSEGRAAIVALSMGTEGAMLVTREQAWYAAALAVDVVSTIGAGDSFLAGLALELARGSPGNDALALGLAASAAALLSSGTALCHAADVRRLQPQVRVQAL